jgi:hypothetical protein
MKPSEPLTNPHQTNAESEPIALGDCLVLWMFLFAFVLFGVIILGDLFAGFFQ